MLPILQETNEMEKLKQLNSILVKELKDSKNEIAKLKGENDILKEKYEEMRGNIKKLISPEDMELKIGHSVDEKSFSLLDEITNKDIEMASIKEEEDVSNSKYNSNKILEMPIPFHEIIDTILNPSADEQFIAVEKFHKPNQTDIAPRHKFTEESDFELITKETITNVPSRTLNAMNYGNDASNDFLVEKSESIISAGPKKQVKERYCYICSKEFTDQFTLKVHVETVHQSIKKFTCDSCGKKFTQKIGLKLHITAVHKKEKNYKFEIDTNAEEMETTSNLSLVEVKNTCPHQSIDKILKDPEDDMRMPCRTVTDAIPKSLIHQLINKTNFWNDDMEITTFLVEKFGSKNQAEKYFVPLNKPEDFKEILKEKISSKVQTNDEEMKNYCEICSKQFKNKFTLKLHFETVHEGIKKFTCDLCGKKFTQKGGLNAHITCVHKKEKNYKCDQCGKAYFQAGGLTNHMTIHSEKRRQCQICQKLFFRLDVLKKHIKRFHFSSIQ